MSLPSLPNECFSIILTFLDNKSLYKCLFINRHYCKLSIPIVWRDPFFLPNSKKSSNSISLINTLLTCLDKDEVSSIISCIGNFDNKTPLFEYGKFIRKFNHDQCVKQVTNWLIINNQNPRGKKLIDAIYHMIMRVGSNLQELNIEITKSSYIELPEISIFTTYKSGISNLRSLYLHLTNNHILDYQDTKEFLSVISKFCNRIINFELCIDGFYKFAKQISDIIRLQPLERICSCRNVISDLELEYRSETLKVLLFKDVERSIDLSFMSKLECLEYFGLEFCYDAIFKHEILNKRKLQLKELKLWFCNITKEIISSLCNETLLKLTLWNITPEIAKIIKESCPNIRSLCIQFGTNNLFDSTIPIICQLKSLKILDIKSFYRIDDNLLVRIIGNYLISVEYLFFDFSIELSSFEYFTNNCKANLKKWIITISNISNNSLRKNYLICVNNFQRVHKSLKVLGIKEYWNWLDCTNEEREIIDSLKNQGIDVISCDELSL
ncbi:hypothetical protein C1645_827093 [Glomus cerebriforme]|uniref:F-box domain-containing protein n=1 Tax=Glomus cerebriforme TaxID=658196 RepID=A0A397STM3_9GLOM|nr:hypothetical protein C1645_827093 [Glomus cerebriforme]